MTSLKSYELASAVLDYLYAQTRTPWMVHDAVVGVFKVF